MGMEDNNIRILTLTSRQRKHALGKSYLENTYSGSLPNLNQGLKPIPGNKFDNNNTPKPSAPSHGGRTSMASFSKSPMNSRRSFPDPTKKYKLGTVRRFLSAEAMSDQHSSCPDLSTKGLVGPDSNISRNRHVQRHTNIKVVPSPPATLTPLDSPSSTPKNVRRRHNIGNEEQSPLLSRSLISNTLMKRRSDLVSEDFLSLSFGSGTSWKGIPKARSGNFHFIYSEDTNQTNEQVGKDGETVNQYEENTQLVRDDEQNGCAVVEDYCGQSDTENGQIYNKEEDEGDIVDQELMDKCRLWLKGVEAAKGQRSLEDVTRADISWR